LPKNKLLVWRETSWIMASKPALIIYSSAFSFLEGEIEDLEKCQP